MIGKEIGNYRILEKIGQGGMGVVYKAVETHLDRVVAVKALNPEYSANPQLLERFRGEARAQAQLNHPNLATLYTFLVVDNIAYMVMEFVEGETFHQLIARRGPIPPTEAVPLFRQALAGVGHAHRLGIVHRDIKPSNLMLNRDGVVKVMDFGLAKVTGGHGVTRTGVRLGTAYYMSPEQILAKPVDVRSDIYSLGATLYEMLTARTPFHADSEFQILNDHVNTAPPPPSGFGAQIPGGIEHAILKALAKEPENRFQTADQFSAALERPEEFYLAATVVDAAPFTPVPKITPAPVQPAVRPKSRWPLLAGIVVVLAAAAAWFVLRPKNAQPPVAVLPSPPPIATPAPAGPVTSPPVAAEPKPSAFPEKAEKADKAAVPPAPPKPAVVPERLIVPAATRVSVNTVDVIDPKASEIGQEFPAKLAMPVTVKGREVFSAGDDATLRLGETSRDAGSKPEMILELTSITSSGQKYQTSSAPFLIKGGLFHKKRVGAGAHINFSLDAPVSVLPHP